jgi:hypothetical protein
MQGFHPCRGDSASSRRVGKQSAAFGGVKIVDTFALHAIPPYSAAGHKALIAQSNLVLTGV